MANIIEVITVLLELIWTIIKMTIVNVRAIFKTFYPNEPKSVSGEIVLITGTGHGMGREMAQRFAKLGATIVCVDINPKGNEETVKMIKQQTPKAKVYKYELDVTDRDAVMALAEKVKKDAGDVTILVNNAGIMPCKPLLDWSQREIQSTMDINVTANLWMIQAFLPAMKKRNHGHIVAMSSIAGLSGLNNLVPYCASKFAVKGLMEAMDYELEHQFEGKSNIKLTTVFPYMVNTGLCKKPKFRFNSMKLVEPGEAADRIVDAVRRDIVEVSIPSSIIYSNKFIGNLISRDAAKVLGGFVQAGVDPHD